MTNLKNKFPKRITKIFNSFLIGSTLLGLSTFAPKAEASAPPL
tara:strand:- start:513 stop:641 length:129 start_codon:yes stop_codon:yes gene_type:complete